MSACTGNSQKCFTLQASQQKGSQKAEVWTEPEVHRTRRQQRQSPGKARSEGAVWAQRTGARGPTGDQAVMRVLLTAGFLRAQNRKAVCQEIQRDILTEGC